MFFTTGNPADTIATVIANNTLSAKDNAFFSYQFPYISSYIYINIAKVLLIVKIYLLYL